jgi:hypothetical protein
MSSLYFVVKNSILTFVIVCLLQVKFGSKTIENRLMNWIRKDLAPTFLGTETVYESTPKIELSPETISKLRKKVYQSSVFKNIKNSAKEIFLNEITEVLKDSENDQIKSKKEEKKKAQKE